MGRHTIRDFYPPDVPEEVRADLSPEWIANGEEFTEMGIPLVAKSGKTVWLSSNGTPILDVDGRITGSRGVDTDITALKRAEENLRASEQLLLRQITEAPVPMAYTGRALDGTMHVNMALSARSVTNRRKCSPRTHGLRRPIRTKPTARR